MGEFSIAGRLIGDQHPPLVIAEIGINHEGSLNTAIMMADAAIDAGAEIIKHQTHVVDDEMSEEAKFVIPANSDVSIYEIMSRCSLSETDEYKLMLHIQSRGAIFLSTPFSRAAADRLLRFNVPAYKIGSGECNNYPLLKHIARFGKPIILSTGMNSISTIRPSVEIFRSAGVPFALLHCTNIYPTPPELVRLGAMQQLKAEFPDAVVGLSDHTISNHACFGAVALGASIIERHFTDRMDRLGPDIVCSMDPLSLTDLIQGSQVIFSARGGEKTSLIEEAPTKAFAFTSVVATKNIEAGELLSQDNIWVRRPSGGDFSAVNFEFLLGQKVIQALSSGERLTKEHLSKSDD
jgi:N-acetylneuraminate synthase